MKQAAALAFGLSLLASPGQTDVTRTTLVAHHTDFVSAIMSRYQFEGTTHSILIEATTDYGDTLPFLFICESRNTQCVMDFETEEYLYVLDFNESYLSIVTLGNEGKFLGIDVFSLP